MRVLRDKAGASLIFVLAAMLLLMALGVSAITAAGYNFSASLTQRNRSQLNLYVSSMEQTIHFSLTGDVTDEYIVSVESLGGWFLKEAYLLGDGHHVINNIPLTITQPNDLDISYSAVISAQMYVTIIPGIDIDGALSEEMATIDGGIVIALETIYAPAAFSGEPLHTTTVITYSYTGGRIMEAPDYPDTEDHDNMIIVASGSWTVVSHEKTDW